MQAPALHSTCSNSAAASHRSSPADFLLTHPILPILRSVFLSAFLWGLIALALYGVYSLIASH